MECLGVERGAAEAERETPGEAKAEAKSVERAGAPRAVAGEATEKGRLEEGKEAKTVAERREMARWEEAPVEAPVEKKAARWEETPVEAPGEKKGVRRGR